MSLWFILFSPIKNKPTNDITKYNIAGVHSFFKLKERGIIYIRL
jgi:hypothetical protein